MNFHRGQSLIASLIACLISGCATAPNIGTQACLHSSGLSGYVVCRSVAELASMIASKSQNHQTTSH